MALGIISERLTLWFTASSFLGISNERCKTTFELAVGGLLRTATLGLAAG